MATTTKAKTPHSDIKGVYYRGGTNPRWQLRIRKMVKGQVYELPLEHYPIDPLAPVGTDEHQERARHFAEKRAQELWNTLDRQIQEGWSKSAHLYTVGDILERYAQEVEEEKIITKNKAKEWMKKGIAIPKGTTVRANTSKEVMTIRLLLGQTKYGHNTNGFSDICRLPIHRMSYDIFYSETNTQAFNWQLKDRKGQKAPASSTRRLLVSLSAIFKHAIEKWHIDFTNPLSQLKGIKVDDKRERIISEDEWNVLINIMNSSRVEKTTTQAIQFALQTAMRRSEISKLDWENIQWNEKTATLIETKSVNGTTRSRTIPLNKEALEILWNIRGETSIKELRGPIFRTRNKNRIRPDTITQCWIKTRKKAYEKTGQTAFLTARFHDIRHTRITELGQFLSPAEVARISGHKDFSTFFRYFNPDPKALGKKIDKHEQALHTTASDLINALSELSVDEIKNITSLALKNKEKKQLDK